MRHDHDEKAGGSLAKSMSSEGPRQRPSAKSSGGKEGRYANIFQVGHNEFEFLIEFGQQDHGIHTRIYMSPQYARVLSELLVETLRQYELEYRRRSSEQLPS